MVMLCGKNLCLSNIQTTVMTDSPKDLTESVTAPGNNLEDNAAESNRVWEAMNRELLAFYDKCVLTRRTSEAHDGYDLVTHVKLKRMYCPPVLKSKNRYALGPREFTLTYSPKWFANDVEARVSLSRAMDKLIKYHKDEITQLRAVGEVGKNGLSHIHCFYQLVGGRKITDKNFKRAWSYWDPSKKLGNGFQGGHHAEVKNTADFLGYIDKDINTAWLDYNLPVNTNHGSS
jgi:hypothetical protein